MTNYEFNKLVLWDYIFDRLLMSMHDCYRSIGSANELCDEWCNDFWLLSYLKREHYVSARNKYIFLSTKINNTLLNY